MEVYNDWDSLFERFCIMTVDGGLSDFSAIVQQTKFQKGEKYSYSITASLATYDDVVVKEGSFTIGN